MIVYVFNLCAHCTDLDKIYDAKLTKVLKKYTVKPITQVKHRLVPYFVNLYVVEWYMYTHTHTHTHQLAVVPECTIFLALSDNEVFFADLESFVILGHLPKSRGATYFAVDWQKLRGRVGLGQELRVGVAAKKRLQLYEWKKSNFVNTKVCLYAIRKHTL